MTRYGIDESPDPWYPATRLNWINSNLSCPVQKKQKIPPPNSISPMTMMKIMADYQFELQLLRETEGFFSSEDIEKITKLLLFIGQISKSSRLELISWADLQFASIQTYYQQFFMPLQDLLDNQSIRMAFHDQINPKNSDDSLDDDFDID